MFMVHNGGVGSMSAASDYEELRRSRQENARVNSVNTKSHIIFHSCNNCRYFWAQDRQGTICPKCNSHNIKEV